MESDIKEKLKDFHDYNQEARKHFHAHEFKPGEPLHIHTEKDLMLYAKWRTKADLALNEYHTLVVQSRPRQLPWNLDQLAKEHLLLQGKLDQTEVWLADNK